MCICKRVIMLIQINKFVIVITIVINIIMVVIIIALIILGQLQEGTKGGALYTWHQALNYPL